MKTKKPTLWLVDSDALLYQISSALEYEMVQLDGHTVILMSDLDACLQQFYIRVKEIVGKSKFFSCFTSTPNFRHEIYPDYKGGRVSNRKPLCYWSVVGKLLEDVETKRITSLEGDDVMSIIATNPKYRQYDIHIWSPDKDMLQVPEVTLHRGGKEHKTRSKHECDIFRYTQALTGDITDGYKGLKGCGPKKAEKILDGLLGSPMEELADVVISQYLDAGETLDYALQMINCATILRYDEYDFKNKRPILYGGF